MINILCYGDSNTFGFKPEHTDDRYDTNTRWTCLLQQKLGQPYNIIEDGLCGRTTNIQDELYPERNGKIQLLNCLQNYKSIDIVLLYLGTNDLNNRFRRNAFDISNAISELIEMIKESNNTKMSKILLVSPTIILDNIINVEDNFGFDEISSKDSKELSKYYKKIADKYGCYFFDAASIVKPSIIDCIHLNEEGHKQLADALFHAIKNIDL